MTDVGTEFALSAVKQSMEQQQALTNGGDGSSKKKIFAKENLLEDELIGALIVEKALKYIVKYFGSKTSRTAANIVM